MFNSFLREHKVAPEASRAIVVLSDTREDPDRADALILNVVCGMHFICLFVRYAVCILCIWSLIA